MSPIPLSPNTPTSLLFGPLSLSLPPSTLATLRDTILSSPHHAWIQRVISSFPALYSHLSTKLPHLQNAKSNTRVEELAAWLQDGKDLEDNMDGMPNTILAPIVVISQLVQYSSFRELQNGNDGEEEYKLEETVGFCIGLLSAFTVSLSHRTTLAEFEKHASTAVRLAMLIGAVVDAQDVQDNGGLSTTLSVAWKRGDAGEMSRELEDILTRSRAAYVSVEYDITRVSITATLSSAPALQQILQNAGFSVTELGLSGRFHSEAHHGAIFEAVLAFCDNNPAFAFPKATALNIPTRSNSGGGLIDSTSASLHRIALESILLRKCEWHATFSALKSSRLSDLSSRLISFGERCIPASLLNGMGGRIVYPEDFLPMTLPTLPFPEQRDNPNDIAVVGMSINVAGASSPLEFWNLLASGKSQHKPVPEDRFTFDTVFRENDKSRTWYGNFIDGVDEFDHKFFKKTPRESMGMDPQQRLLLQCAYQAVEQSGYYNLSVPHVSTNNKDGQDEDSEETVDSKNIGCYIGLCGNDYVANTSHHAPNAFTATGTLRSFVAGKLSHYFGWLGPSLTVDTACSASAVAIHTACRAILSGECSAALAGGTNVITEPGVYQNLAGASFLSPTGACKPFDAKADGYCRGEAVTVVFLKSLKRAQQDGDVVLGVISGTAVAQNSNDTPIVVPNAPSLSTLFRRVLRTAKLEPNDISAVEAHGTGTPVGDPAEYASIRNVFGQEKGIQRPTPLHLGSVKGLVGHTEGSSGAVSLVKVLCMMHEAAIPPQASHSVMNPAIGAKESDGIQITTQLKSWEADFKAALINNYGASGSNASMVVTQAPKQNEKIITPAAKDEKRDLNLRYPFWIPGLDDRSIRAYATKLRELVQQKPSSSIEDLSFNMSRQSNRTLSRALILTARSVSELIQKLTALESGSTEVSSLELPSPRPVILSFGGQLSTTIGLDRSIYNGTALLRRHMDRCNILAISLGAGSIYPAVFQATPISDIVLLQTALFALQYSTAKCWIECGVKPVAVVGHSFGELTALCVSGVLSLEDAMRVIIARATIIRDSWGTEKGAMCAVEGSEEEVLQLLKDAGQGSDATIACFNGPRSHTIAGSQKSVDAVVQTLLTKHLGLRFKKLAVSNAFHSSLVAPLKSELRKIGQGLKFNTPSIPVEKAAHPTTCGDAYTPDFIADHLHNPVYFSHAVQRLAKRHPSAIWLEAGSNATITSMASKALVAPSNNHFQAVNISCPQGLQRLIDTTILLWKAGLRVAYWGHSKAQTNEYKAILLPPYQFEKKKHWLEHKAPPNVGLAVCNHVDRAKEELPTKLYTFTGYQDTKQRLARFRINTMIPKYDVIVAGHTIAGAEPICPATVQIDIAIEALRSLGKKLTAENMQPQIRNIVNLVPVCVDTSRSVWLDVEALDSSRTTWNWKWTSTGASGAAPTTHVIGEMQFRASSDVQYQSEFARYERLVSHRRCVQVLHSEDADEMMQGQRSIYRRFSPIVDYSSLYFGLQKLVGQDSESAGRVVKKHSGDSWLDAFLADAFCQVAGIWVNCMTEGKDTDMWIANGIEQWTRSPSNLNAVTTEKWHVFGQHSRAADGNSVLSDLFVFDATTGMLAEVILGIKYAKVSRTSMGKLLSRLTASEGGARKAPVAESSPPVLMASAELPPAISHFKSAVPRKAKRSPESSLAATIKKLKEILADISGLEVDEIRDDVELGDIGVDSLMGMEMAREIEKGFQCTLPQDELVHVTNFPGLLKCLELALNINIEGGDSPSSSSSSSSSSDEAASEASDGYRTPVSVATDNTSPISTPVEEFEFNAKSDSLPVDLELTQSAILKAFGESKLRTDQLIGEYNAHGYLNTVIPEQDQLCVGLTVEAFRDLGCDLSTATPGQELSFIPHADNQKKFAQYLYTVLETARLVNLDDGLITRTHITVPKKASSDLLRELMAKYPEHACSNELAHWTGSHLASILTGREDGIKLIFGTERGRELVGSVYADFPLNKLYYAQMGDFITRLASEIPQRSGQGPLRILEMGAGTGATTKNLVPLLANLGIEVEYTFTDLASSFVAAARKNFKRHPFMKFRVHDIEKAPAEDLMHSQHIVIASNAVHATRSLPASTANIHKMLRPDGLLLLVEMTQPMYWCDIIFGVFEGWWLFEDGRKHAVAPPETWEKDLHSVGYGHVDWSDGHAPEVACERLILATARGSQCKRLPISTIPTKEEDFRHDARRAATDTFTREATAGFEIPSMTSVSSAIEDIATGSCVLITGATGSLGAHMVAHYANLSSVSSVICLNRRSSSKSSPLERQLTSLSSKGLTLDPHASSKLTAFETDTTKPYLGLPQSSYKYLTHTLTHIVHNAWPMNAKQPLSAFVPQFRVLRHLLDLVAAISASRPEGFRVRFQFISSIATVGHYPFHKGSAHIPEERMTIESVLPNGYGDAKFVCERMLDETLHKHPAKFNAMVVRLGQVAGSSKSGYWNANEHLPFLIKSSQTLRCLPNLEGPLSWTPVDLVAGVCAELALGGGNGDGAAENIYHIDNPVRQPWSDMLPLLAAELNIPLTHIVPFEEWIRRVRAFPSHTSLSGQDQNPAKRLVDFVEEDFKRMSCGGVLMESERCQEHSHTMRSVGRVEKGVVRRFIDRWRGSGFLV
ncbi:hypothetical protein K505DRAFT_228585 [Melanomma pulvis-pyrius CBS 109.77]|uniref:Uncharacterized protein n=1 Tax=Melanomma pulvis-pyrius CBS 109.77 TaxID=1314802 RepID=A0A6A6XVN3_9PLEO|nr:hypothetical protein K505DRAFT_228585 [Melanomma pulvis-pyrius CBS 109.77]